MPQSLHVLALSATNQEKTHTWRLRVGLLTPHLQARNIFVETCWLPREAYQRRALFARLRGFDLVWIHRALFWPRELRLLRGVGRHLVLDIDDPVCYSSSAFANFKLARWLKFPMTTRACSAIVAASDGLVELARRHNPNTILLPLCADPEAYSMRPRHRISDDPLRLLWMGAKSTFKYLAQVRPHLEAVGRACPCTELTVVGHSELELSSMPVHNRPWSHAEDQAALARCHVGLVPMADDRWTRAKAALKPLQYLASGMPFIGSRVGINCRLADEGRNGLLANDAPEWVDAVRRLHEDEPLRYRMGSHGVTYIRQHHSAEGLAERLAELFWSLTGQAAPARRAAA
jgi:glycosyltransferase involved in cell wall biosynthesis